MLPSSEDNFRLCGILQNSSENSEMFVTIRLLPLRFTLEPVEVDSVVLTSQNHGSVIHQSDIKALGVFDP